MAGEKFTVPLAIDPSGFITGLDEIDAGITQITAKAKNASTAIAEAMTTSNRAGDALVTKMNAGAASAKSFSDAAKAAGVDITKALSGDNVNTDGIKQKVTQFIASLKDATGKPIDFKFNIDQATVKTLVTKITEAKSEMSAFNVVLDSAKQRLQGLQQGSQAFNELNDQIGTAETFLKNLGNASEDTEAKTSSLKSQLKQMKEELAQMEIAGKAGTAEFIELAKRAGDLKDQLNDTSNRIKSLASDTKGFDAGITAIRGLAGAFASAQGAMALFGDQNEELQKTIAKVQGAMALLQGIQEIANVLNKDSALSVYIQTFASKARAEALAAETVAIGAETVATETATAATEAWTIALLTNPITLLIGVLAAVAFGVYELSKAQKQAGLNAEQFNKFLEIQKGLLEEDLSIIQRRQNVTEAQLSSERKNQSAIQELRLNALREQKLFNQQQFEDVSKSRLQLDGSDKDYAKSVETINKELEALEKKRRDINAQIRAEGILLEKQKNEEQIKLKDELLKEKQLEFVTEVEIANQAKNYLNQIQDAKIAELREGQEKELKVLDQALKVKIQGLEAEQNAKLVGLKNQKADLEIERQLADENGKIVIDAQIRNLSKQIKLVTENGEKVKALEVESTNATEFAKAEVRKKYAEQRRDIEFQVANTLLGIEKESAKQKEAILTLAAEHEIDIIERSNQDKQTKDIQEAAIEKRLKKEIADSNFQFLLKDIENQRLANENKLAANKKFFDKSRDAQALANLLILKNNLEAADAELKAVLDRGDKATKAEIEQAKNKVLKLKGAVDEAVKQAKPINIFELLFPDDNKNQKNAENFSKALDQVGKAIDAFTAMQIANYQKRIDEQKKVVKNDDDAVKKLQDQLKEEESLRDKGYANNVDGIKKELSEKNKQRDEDIKKADEYQKKMAKIQKAQITAQTVLQAVQLATAGTNILIQATAEGGPVGAVIGALAVAGMIAAFIAEKKAAYDAVNTTTSFGGGGIVKGKSHAQGGQKYYAPDATGGIVEIEQGEHITSKKQTEKYLPLLEAVNHDKLKDMDDNGILSLLNGIGVHLQTDRQHKEALSESREHTSHQINQITIEANPKTPKEIVNIDKTLQELASRNNEQVQVYEENGYIVTRKGQTIRKIKKL